MHPKAIRVYVDTSVFGGAFDREFAHASITFLNQVRAGRFHLVLSPAGEEEIADAPGKVKALFQEMISLAEVIPIGPETLRLQEAFLKAGILSERWALDALHVAHAFVCRCSMIISWNFRHIVHFDKIPLYNAIAVREGFSPIGIHTPQEVIDYDSEDL